MSIFNVNFSQVWEDLYPPVLRKTTHLNWGTSLMKPLQYLRDVVFNDYADGATYSAYSSISAYTALDRVIYIDRGVYENLSGSTGVAPTDTNTWYKVNDNYIGVRERIKYNSQKQLFEYGLNRWFQVPNINTPWTGANHTTQIYIENTPNISSAFLLGQTGAYSTTMSNGANNQYYLGNIYSGYNTSTYTIWVPMTTYTGLSTTTIESENIIRSFADNYNLAGMIYSVSGY